MTHRDIAAEIDYRVNERLALLGYTDELNTPEQSAERVKREIHADVRRNWPAAYREAVEKGMVVA